MLTLMDELFLLALDGSKGIVNSSDSNSLAYGLAGSLLAELALEGNIRLGESGRLEVAGEAETGDEILAKALQEMRASERPRKTTYWVKYFLNKPKKLRQKLGERSIEMGLLSPDEDCYLWVTPSPLNPERESSAKYEIKDRLRSMILACGEADLRSLALLSLASASRMLKVIFTKDERQAAQGRIQEMLFREALGNPVAQSIEEISEAVKTVVTYASS